MLFTCSSIPNIQKKSLAFTLAEVLITLGIIGVIAAITIPTLISNSEERKRTVQFKKMYAQMGVAVGLVAESNGGTLRGAYPDTDTEALRDFFAPFFKGAQKCDLADCLPTDNPGRLYKYMTGNSYSWALGNVYGLTMPDGGSYIFGASRNPGVLDISDGKGAIYYAGIYIDINGPQGQPNRFGVDMYLIYLGDGFVTPTTYDAGFNDCRQYGGGCSRYILLGNK